MLLVDPPNHCLRGPGSAQHVHPLGLGYVAAALSPHHDVVQLVPDVRDDFDGDPWLAIGDTIAAARPDLVGLTAVTSTFPSARRVARLARERLGPDVPIVLGGVHATTLPEAGFAEPAIDFVVRGEGEATVVELVRALEAGGSIDAIPGLWRRTMDGVRHGHERPAERDLDRLSFPRREGILWPEWLQPGLYQSVITLRGCPYACIYCAVPGSTDKKTRYRSPANVADEVALLRDRYDVPYVFFHDSVFTLHRGRTLELCDELERRDLRVPFCCQTRTDRVDPELLGRLRAAGCHQIFFGIESGDVESLRRMRKSMPLAEIRAAVAEVKRLGIRCSGFFIVGFPWETAEHIRNTADFATDIGLDGVSLFSATPLPGTELWEMSAAHELPDAIDFRSPQVNLTSMPHAEYAALFREVRARMDQYNQACMKAALEHWPKG